MSNDAMPTNVRCTAVDLVERLRELAARKWPDAGNREASLFGRAADEIERLRTALAKYEADDVRYLAEIRRLRAALRYQDDRDGHVGTHGPGCYAWGHRHYECALREIEKLNVAIKRGPTA